MPAIWINVLNAPANVVKLEMYLAVSSKKHPDAVASKKLTPVGDEPYIISGLLRNTEMSLELSHLCEVAFELGRAYGAEHGSAPKKKRIRANKKK